MEYKRIEDKIVFRLEMGDRLMESTQKIAAAESVKLASINGIGACSKIEMGYIDLNIKEYIFKTFEGNLEILHATGNITLKDGELCTDNILFSIRKTGRIERIKGNSLTRFFWKDSLILI